MNDAEPHSPADCVFCAIVAGRGDASRVYEDETYLAFLDIRPVTPGHLLVIPKRLYTHLHVFPRFRKDGFALRANWKMVERAELDSIATNVRVALEANRS